MYLLDTNICVYFMNGKFDLANKIRLIGLRNCYISEITVAELKFGVENSQQIEKNKERLEIFLQKLQIIPIIEALDLYAKEKARLRKIGTTIDDFDLLIGVTSLAHNMVMVTNNTEHFSRIKEIKLEDWTKN